MSEPIMTKLDQEIHSALDELIQEFANVCHNQVKHGEEEKEENLEHRARGVAITIYIMSALKLVHLSANQDNTLLQICLKFLGPKFSGDLTLKLIRAANKVINP